MTKEPSFRRVISIKLLKEHFGMGFFLYNFKTWFQKNTTGKMFEQVTLQRFFLGVNHLKKSRRYFEKKNLQNQEKVMKKIRITRTVESKLSKIR